MESKRNARSMLILFILTLYGIFDLSLEREGCWFVRNFSRIFPKERLHPNDKTLISFNHLFSYIQSLVIIVSLHEKNRHHYLLAAGQWLCKYICKSSMRSLESFSLFQVPNCWNTVWLWCYHVRALYLLRREYTVKYFFQIIHEMRISR